MANIMFTLILNDETDLIFEQDLIQAPLFIHTQTLCRRVSRSPSLTDILNLMFSIKTTDSLYKLHRIWCWHQMI